jgi:hypothetical protein
MYSAVVAAFLASLSGTPATNADVCGTHVSTAAALIEALLAAPGTKVTYETPQLISIADQPHLRAWSVGKLANGHPVVVCREVVKEGDHFRIDTHVVCDGSANECQKFVLQFRS